MRWRRRERMHRYSDNSHLVIPAERSARERGPETLNRHGRTCVGHPRLASCEERKVVDARVKPGQDESEISCVCYFD